MTLYELIKNYIEPYLPPGHQFQLKNKSKKYNCPLGH